MNEGKKNKIDVNYLKPLFGIYHLAEVLGVNAVLEITECDCSQVHKLNGKRYHYLCELDEFIVKSN